MTSPRRSREGQPERAALREDLIEPTLDLWLIRHGETDWNRERRIQGRSDAQLSDLGRRQAQRLARRLAGERFDAAFSSDLSRALDTARCAMPDIDLAVDPRLREIDLGRFEGRLFHELSDDDAREVRSWVLGPYDLRVGGGESSDDLGARLWAWFEGLPPSGRVVAFSHGGAIGTLLHTLLGRPPRLPGDGVARSFRFGNTSISRVLVSPTSVTVLSVNDTAHLLDLADG